MDEDRDPSSPWGSGYRRDGGMAREAGGARPQGRAGQGAGAGRGGEPLEQRLERWVSRGRDLVDGVSGARPGGRGAGPEGRAGARGGAGFNPARLGRWVEERIDWLLDDDAEETWREPWQEAPARTEGGSRQASTAGPPGPAGWPPAPGAAASGLPRQRRSAAAAAPQEAPRGSGSGRRGLEAISRRGPQSPAAGAAAAPSRSASGAIEAAPDDDWPDPASFSLNRWQRPQRQRAPEPPEPPPPAESSGGGRRPLPRSSRRR